MVEYAGWVKQLYWGCIILGGLPPPETTKAFLYFVSLAEDAAARLLRPPPEFLGRKTFNSPPPSLTFGFPESAASSARGGVTTLVGGAELSLLSPRFAFGAEKSMKRTIQPAITQAATTPATIILLGFTASVVSGESQWTGALFRRRAEELGRSDIARPLAGDL